MCSLYRLGGYENHLNSKLFGSFAFVYIQDQLVVHSELMNILRAKNNANLFIFFKVSISS